ncbi:hypothetical protein BDV25DRAFT_135072 [Aspergillus avenaceus]|uniref:N-acetylglucosaminylphosphatidylinositol deacetylase n=1 Tax=Aspergillus avenaceus TaxID=36643 RepID=A0A5N6U9N0_ASPAV|nr:hypothetical protein BDV25DRAFT_135072 [Aspergillus avenaceus]
MRPSTFLGSIAVLGPIALTAAQTLNIVPHQDDDLLFMTPDLINEVRSGREVRTVFLTAGDAGNGENYWIGRQAGSLAAYAQMAGVANDWIEEDVGLEDYDIPLYTLTGKPQISLAFMHMPDGNMDGSGFAATGYQSLQKLWEGSIDQIGTVDDSGTTYDRDELLNVLATIIEQFGPDRINTLDFVNDVGQGDHSDHYTGAYFADSAAGIAENNAQFVGYMGYNIAGSPVNLDANAIADKKSIFYLYGTYDTGTCSSDASCAGRPELSWLERQYTV